MLADYPQIEKMAVVRVLNFNDEHEGIGKSLKHIAYNGYNAFRLVRFRYDNHEENHNDNINAIQSYIAEVNKAREANNIQEYLKEDDFLILQKTTRGHMYAIPFEYYKNDKHSMFSGIFITGDSSMSELTGHNYPIGVHNRQE